MNRRLVNLVITSGLGLICFANSLTAQSICGEAPVVTDLEERIELGEAAQDDLRASLGSNVSAIEQRKNDIFRDYSDGQRAIAYYQYVVCRIIEQDVGLSPSEKVRELDRAYGALFTPMSFGSNSYWFWVLNPGEVVTRSNLIKDGRDWWEMQNGEQVYAFREVNRSEEFIHISDSSRGLEIKIPVLGGKSLIRYVGERWREWNWMTGKND